MSFKPSASAVGVLMILIGGGSLQLAAQTVSGHSIQGEWSRTDSNNRRNDTMRITVGPTGAVLQLVPASASASWKVGQTLWKALQPDGSVQVLGSSGTYYDATLTLVGRDEIHVDIHYNGRGNDQTWRRRGPSLDGDWVRVDPAGGWMDGMMVTVSGPTGRIRTLPPAAPRPLRVGSRFWRDIRSDGAAQVFAAGGSQQGSLTLVGSDTLQVVAGVGGFTGPQIWVRPGILAGVGPADSTAARCLSTSIPHDRAGMNWRLGLSSPAQRDSIREVLGIWDYKMSRLPSSANTFPLDLERSIVPGMPDGLAFVWEEAGPARETWQRLTATSALMYAGASQSAQGQGLMPLDVEAHMGSGSTTYNAIWIENVNGIVWWADHDLTAARYDQEYSRLSAEGYRPIDFESYATPGGQRYAAIWYKSCDRSTWRHTRDLTRSEYQAQVTQLSALGFQVVDFESYLTPNGQRYAAIWQHIPPGRGWAVRTDRSLNAFLNVHRQYVDEGMRLLDYEVYDTPNGVRYGGVWIENDRRYDFALKAAVDSAVVQYRRLHRVPAISVVVMQPNRRSGRGEVLYRRGFGWADSARQRQAHTGTIYRTASVAKVIGGTLAGRLEDQGHLDLTRPTSDYLSFLAPAHQHTVEQLLAKVGCVRHYDGRWLDPNHLRDASGQRIQDPTFYATRDSAISRIEFPLLNNCTPGSDYRYSTHGFTFVGAVLEQVLGKDIHSIIRDELTIPFGLPSLQVATPAGPVAGVPYFHQAQGYVYDSSATATTTMATVDYEESTWKVLGGGLQIDAIDLARFGSLTYEGRIADTTRLWTSLTMGDTVYRDTLAAPNVGLAWELRNATVGTSSLAVAEHGGTASGARTWLTIFRGSGLVVAVLTNQRNGFQNPGRGDTHPVAQLTRSIAAAVRANPPPP